MKKVFVLLLTLCFLAGNLQAGAPVELKLQAVLDQFIADNPDIPGVMATLDSDRLDLNWSGSAGVSDLLGKTPIQPDQPLRLASTTKTYVAAAILRLMENHKLKLDDTLDRHLPEQQLETLRKGGYIPAQITIRHLLTHTSGVFDYAMSENYLEAVMADPAHRWTRDEQLQFSMDHGAPYGKAGEYFHYSDGGYILLGEIIERRSGLGPAAALRKLLKFDTLGLTSTWLETLEPVPEPAPARAHQYYAETDTNDWDASLDLYGGGGLVANMPDLALFFKALFNGDIFERPATLATMLTSIVPEHGGPAEVKEGYGSFQYCLGIYATAYRDFTIFQHGGFWGTKGLYIPALGLSGATAVTQQQSREQHMKLLNTLLDVVIEAQIASQ